MLYLKEVIPSSTSRVLGWQTFVFLPSSFLPSHLLSSLFYLSVSQVLLWPEIQYHRNPSHSISLPRAHNGGIQAYRTTSFAAGWRLIQVQVDDAQELCQISLISFLSYCFDNCSHDTVQLGVWALPTSHTCCFHPFFLALQMHAPHLDLKSELDKTLSFWMHLCYYLTNPPVCGRRALSSYLCVFACTNKLITET